MTGEPTAAPVPTQRATPVTAALPYPPSPSLDRLADLARRLLATDCAEVHLLTGGEARVSSPAACAGTPGTPVTALCAVVTSSSQLLVVPDAAADPRCAVLPEVRDGLVRSFLGVPLRNERGRVLGVLCAHEPEPRTWHVDEVEVLGQLARSVVAEIELAALAGEYQESIDRWELAIDAAGVGSFDWDLVTGRLLWDDRLLAMFGYDRADFGRSIADFEARVHPDDLPRVRTVLDSALEDCGHWAVDYRVVHPDGTNRWVTARGRALRGAGGTAERMLGAAYDSTDLHDSQARTARVLEAMSAGFYSLDRDWCFTYVNAEAERILGRRRDELLGGSFWELFPAAVGSDFEHHFRAAVEGGRTASFEAYYPAPLDGWYELRAWPSPDGLSVYFLDITARRAAEAELQSALRRAQLVADVTTQLSDTLDAEEAVARLAHLLVPELAHFCIVTLVDDDGRLRDVGWSHADPAMQDDIARYAAVRLDALTDRSQVAVAMRTGQPTVVHGPVVDRLDDIVEPGEARELLRRLRPSSGAVLPMPARGRTVGLLNLFKGPDGPPYDEAQLATARDVAARAALALDNARLFQQQRRLAAELQRSLLTPPPAPDHLEVAVRYAPAAQAAQVGGDWYDAFLQPDGATVLVIGDVVGHDTAAAAAMGQVRGLLRGIAYTSGEGPAAVLTRLDAALEGLEVGTNASAVVARLEQTGQERSDGVTHLRWSNAGHPPPMVVQPSGTVRVLDVGPGLDDADLLLGIDPSSERTERSVVLERGSTVLLYTDGLVERRGEHLDDSLAALRDALAELGPLTLQELCDELLRRLPPEAREDDVAMVAVRLHPQDAPRPVQAGPQHTPPGVPPDAGVAPP